MARFSRRQVGAARTARRTNWFGFVGSLSIDDADLHTQLILDVADTAGESSNYVDATLTRIRGHILVDPDFGAAAGSQIMHTFLALYVGPSAPSGDLIDGTPGAVNMLGSDRIIWTGAIGASRQVTITEGSQDVDKVIEYAVIHPALQVDVKAQRRMGDDNRIYLCVQNLGGSGAVPGFISWGLRVLFKE